MNISLVNDLTVEIESLSQNEKHILVMEATEDNSDAQILTSSEEASFKVASHLLSWPGEYEVKGVMLKGIEDTNKTVVFVARVEEMTVVHLGKAVEVSSEIVNKLGDIDILFLPVGNGIRSAKAAKELADRIEARIIIPVGDAASEFVAMSGMAKREDVVGSKVKILKAALPQDKTEIVELIK